MYYAIYANYIYVIIFCNFYFPVAEYISYLLGISPAGIMTIMQNIYKSEPPCVCPSNLNNSSTFGRIGTEKFLIGITTTRSSEVIQLRKKTRQSVVYSCDDGML